MFRAPGRLEQRQAARHSYAPDDAHRVRAAIARPSIAICALLRRHVPHNAAWRGANVASHEGCYQACLPWLVFSPRCVWSKRSPRRAAAMLTAQAGAAGVRGAFPTVRMSLSSIAIDLRSVHPSLTVCAYQSDADATGPHPACSSLQHIETMCCPAPAAASGSADTFDPCSGSCPRTAPLHATHY